MHITKKPIWKKATRTIWLQLYDILEKGNYGDSKKKKISGCHGLEGERDD